MSQTEKTVRHLLWDRVFHWLFAGAIFTLLLTGLLPPFGIDFSWVTIHWVTGVILILLLLVHILRSVFLKDLKAIKIKASDFSKRPSGSSPEKYSLEQKLMHNFLALIALAAIITGGLMTVKIDTPFWERNPYWLEASTWGWVYVIHGLLALVFVSTIMLHIYFALRPEKRMFLRAIFKG